MPSSSSDVQSARREPAAALWPIRWYAAFSGVFLLVQGASTLAARLIPEVDAAFPALLATTRMVPSHSILHIATAALAFAAIAAGPRAMFAFAVGFGGFYVVLAAAGAATGHPMGLGLQAFDHPFHLLLGGLGLIAAWRARRAR